jgi:hypothetical protein
VFPVEIGLRDPRSQKRDLGHPSISPFDIAEGTCFVISLPTRLSKSAAPRDDNCERSDVAKHFHERSAELQIPPRHAGTGRLLGMTKERATVPERVVAGPRHFSSRQFCCRDALGLFLEKQQLALKQNCHLDRIAKGLWQSQRDEKRLGPATTLYGTVALSFVIPSVAEGSAVPRTLRGSA